MLRIGVAVCGLVGLTGCLSVGPDYEVPELGPADAWNQDLMGDFKSGEGDGPGEWWTVFDDAMLNELITSSSTNSLDLRIAMLRVEEAAALSGAARADWYPKVLGQGAVQATEISAASNPSLPEGADRSGEFYTLGLGVAWELDLWGRVRRSVESADANLDAVTEDYRDTVVILYAAIATSYMEVRTLQQRISYAEKNINLQQGTFSLTTNRYETGLSSKLDVRQAELNLATTRSALPALKAQLTQAMNRVGVLTGQEPSRLWPELKKVAAIPEPQRELSVGVPVDVLRQRPDVRAAERRLASQTARIGVAKAELYPQFSLPGTFALEALEAGDLSGSDALAYSFGPTFKWNLFAGGAVRRAIDVEESRTAQALAGYEKSVLTAVEEVENAMSALQEERQRLESLGQAVDAARHSVELVKTLYKSGLTDFQNVLDMERSLAQQEDQFALSQGARALSAIRLYKALGGGWTPEMAAEEE